MKSQAYVRNKLDVNKLNSIIEYLHLNRTQGINAICLHEFIPEVENSKDGLECCEALWEEGLIDYHPIENDGGAIVQITKLGSNYWRKGYVSVREYDGNETLRRTFLVKLRSKFFGG